MPEKCCVNGKSQPHQHVRMGALHQLEIICQEFVKTRVFRLVMFDFLLRARLNKDVIIDRSALSSGPSADCGPGSVRKIGLRPRRCEGSRASSRLSFIASAFSAIVKPCFLQIFLAPRTVQLLVTSTGRPYAPNNCITHGPKVRAIYG